MAKKKTKSKTNGKTKQDGNHNVRGRFVKGNKAAAGRSDPESIHRARMLKQALIETVTEKDIRDITKKLIQQAKNGSIKAIRELYDRLFGRAPQDVKIGAGKGTFDFKVIISGKVDGPAQPEIDRQAGNSLDGAKP